MCIGRKTPLTRIVKGNDLTGSMLQCALQRYKENTAEDVVIRRAAEETPVLPVASGSVVPLKFENEDKYKAANPYFLVRSICIEVSFRDKCSMHQALAFH